LGEVSPLQAYCKQVDLKYYEKTYGWYYYDLALKQVPTDFITNLVLKDFEWRANHQQNILSSTEGVQSSGKSLFTLNMAIHAGNFFHFPFILKRDIYSNPYQLDQDIRNNEESRRTFLYDEQPQRMVGMGSYSTKISLKDYEEIGRYTQKNVFYCSPEVHEHAHYFVFKQVDYDIDRLTNEKCKSCALYAKCNFEKYSTLCEIPFFERDGYPKQFRFMLYTKRLSDQVLMPRGIVSFPMLAPKTAKEYDSIKSNNIKNFENYANNAWDKKMGDIEKFVDEFEQELIKETYKGIAPVNKRLIESKLYEKFGQNRFLKDEIAIFVEIARQLLQEKCAEQNGKN